MSPRRHLLNSAVITAEGRFEYRRLSADEAVAWIAAGPIDTDHAGHEAVMMYTLTRDLPDHPMGSTVSAETLRAAGVDYDGRE